MKLYRYHSSYRSQFIQAKGTMGKVRSGCVLVWKSQSYRALGECAPLKGFSEESILECLDEFRRFESEVENVLTRFEEDFTNCPFPSLSVLGRWEQEVTQWFNPKYPSLRFGISMLMYDWLSQRYNLPMHSFFLRLYDDVKQEVHNDASYASVPVNALLPILDTQESLVTIDEIIKKGYEVVKIKVSGNHEDNIRLLSQIKDRVPNLRLRLDANAQWSAENFLPWAKKYSELDLEYIEQPFSKSDFTVELRKCTRAKVALPPFAADESCAGVTDFYELLHATQLPYYIIKPTLMGGLSDILKVIIEAKKHHSTCVLSSSFDGIISRKVIASLANFSNYIGEIDIAHGLDTGKWLIETYGSPEFLLMPEIQNGRFNLEDTLFNEPIEDGTSSPRNNAQRLSLERLVSIQQLEPIPMDA